MDFELPLSRSSRIPKPNPYVTALTGEYSPWAISEERAKPYKGQWRTEVFGCQEPSPMDLEIGTGNGTHFAHRALNHPDRLSLGLEIKFKPLIQSIRRALKGGAPNARMVRYEASALSDIFAEGELNNVFIHFPDPWPKRRHHKNRLVRQPFLEGLFRLQVSGSILEFKTDNRDYFDFAVSEIQKGPYKIIAVTYDLHNSQYRETNFITQFENIFLRQSLPIHYLRAQKASE